MQEPPPGAHGDWTIPQSWKDYSDADHRTWLTLCDRQEHVLARRACDEFLQGLQRLELRGRGVPDFEALSERLCALTGWRVVAVPGLVPDEIFFEHLANRRFPAGRFVRRMDQLDYLQEPDVFHDVYGHVPMLANPVFADYMAAYGRAGHRALMLGRLVNLARLYWYTVEFGLVHTAQGLRLFGAGIVSSSTESIYALESDLPHRLEFKLERVMRTPYCIDHFQQLYFVIDSVRSLLDLTLNTDFGPLYEKLAAAREISIETILPGDRVVPMDARSGAAHPAPRASSLTASADS